MAKSSAKSGAKAGTENKKNFEERLEHLEGLGEKIRKPDIPLDEALKAFEEGIKLARALEKDLAKIESRIEILMNNPEAGAEEEPDLGLFDEGE
ncbi:MAG: exodeoxyribonuclease VII small subunit [Treponema sp.]|jgi:exodeoxyribonuclease VII small subunit|nr:exodeoxyribonuclease VII small subunit [Treponema sp.]